MNLKQRSNQLVTSWLLVSNLALVKIVCLSVIVFKIFVMDQNAVSVEKYFFLEQAGELRINILENIFL